MKVEKRKILQFSSAILYNLNFIGFKDATIYTGALKKMCVPGLNCYSCPGAIMSCPIGAFQNHLMSIRGLNGIIIRFPYYVLGLILFFGVIFGRVVCGFLCPFGLFQELLYKIKSVKVKKNHTTKKITKIKYFILIIFVILLPIILKYPSFCKFICPAGTLEAGIVHTIFNKRLREIIGFLFMWKFLILFVVVALSIFVYRPFCRFICPLGAIYGFFNKVSIFGLKIDLEKCTHCNACINYCLMDVKMVGDMECIECGECMKVCKEGAIKRYKV